MANDACWNSFCNFFEEKEKLKRVQNQHHFMSIYYDHLSLMEFWSKKRYDHRTWPISLTPPPTLSASWVRWSVMPQSCLRQGVNPEGALLVCLCWFLRVLGWVRYWFYFDWVLCWFGCLLVLCWSYELSTFKKTQFLWVWDARVLPKWIKTRTVGEESWCSFVFALVVRL